MCKDYKIPPYIYIISFDSKTGQKDHNWVNINDSLNGFFPYGRFLCRENILSETYFGQKYELRAPVFLFVRFPEAKMFHFI